MRRVLAWLGRVYVERSSRLSLRLYITRIDESDAGLYTCSAALATAAGSRDQQPSPRQRRMLTLSQHTKLFLYGLSPTAFSAVL